MIKRVLNPKKCRQCGEQYTPRSTGQVVCSLPCSIARVNEKNAREHEGKLRKIQGRQAAEIRRRKESVKTLTQWRKEAQNSFNRYIRVRDHGVPCISCGQSAFQGQRHASHYRSRAAASQLAYNTFNVNTSCAQCNSSKSGNILEYRIGLIAKIGEERVLELEHNNEKARYTVGHLQRIKRIFNQKARLYEKRRKS